MIDECRSPSPCLGPGVVGAHHRRVMCKGPWAIWIREVPSRWHQTVQTRQHDQRSHRNPGVSLVMLLRWYRLGDMIIGFAPVSACECVQQREWCHPFMRSRRACPSSSKKWKTFRSSWCAAFHFNRSWTAPTFIDPLLHSLNPFTSCLIRLQPEHWVHEVRTCLRPLTSMR